MSYSVGQKQFILQYMQRRDVPLWYRGISPFQMDAAEQLSNAIRDDTEQNTTHRVRRCLVRLGLLPPVRAQDLSVIMKLSGGNDLAFLFFLMELYYKTKGNKYNSLNEQLILTSICHLDMITTLRELDRILPPGHASKRQIELRQQRQSHEKRNKNKPRKLVKKRSSPYFDKLARPRKFGKPLTLERPDYKVRFARYDAYKDPNYIPPNEYNRWYAHHVFRGAERVTKATLRECLAEIMNDIDFSDKNYSRAASIISDALNFDRAARDEKIMCAQHRLEEEDKELRRMQFFMKQRENCLKSLELFSGKKQAQAQKILDMLNKEVEMYRLHYRKMNAPHVGDQSYIRILGKQEYAEHYIKDDLDCSGNLECRTLASTISLKNFDPGSHRNSIEHLTTPKRNRLSFEHSDHNFDMHYYRTTTPPSSQHYFVRPTDHKPYHFDYAKIFDYKNSDDKKPFIKNKCVEAMDKEPRFAPKMVDLTPDLRKVAKNCANETWEKKERKWRAEDDAKVVEESISIPDSYPKDMPRLPFYDCEDRDLMDRMLKIALCEMRKQPKFVLASLPDAYKIPVLREWISQRYGKRYTQAQQLGELNISLKIMNTLQNLKFKTKLPKPSAIGLNSQQTYDCHRYIMEKERIARLRKQIESDINMHMQRFKEQTKKSQSNLLLTSKGDQHNCSKCSSNSEMPKRRSQMCANKENKSASEPQYRYVLNECGIERQKVKPKDKPKPLRERSANNACVQKRYRKTPCETELIGDSLKNSKHWKSCTEQIFVIPSKEKMKLPRLRRLCSCDCTCPSQDAESMDSTREYMRNYNYGHTDTSSFCSSGKTYFNAPKKDQPFKFDYSQIFDMKSPYDPRHLRKMCAKAIADRDDDDDKSSSEYHSRKCKSRSRESVRSAINEYTDRTFNANVKLYNQANDENLAEMKMQATNYARTYYDPNDKELMHSMLEDGLKQLQKDARYVLPSLPDAHKMPVLRYWMYQRYGKVYTTKELMAIFKRSLQIFRALSKLHVREKMPTADLIGRAVYTNYSCHDYLIRKTDHIRDLFYKSMDQSIMEQTRRLFMAMSPYLCIGRPQNKLIFAYLPARPSDIHHFHVWSNKESKKKSKKSKSTAF